MLVRLLLAVCFTQFIFAQEQIVKGIVLFEGIPLEGASVIVKDFNIGTITDASGAFSLTLSNIKNPKITISYLGYKSFNLKINKISNDLGNIELVSDDKLDEVVISGTLNLFLDLRVLFPLRFMQKVFLKLIQLLLFLKH